MRITKSVDSPEKLLAVALLGSVLAACMLYGLAWQGKALKRFTNAKARPLTVSKTGLKVPDIGRSGVHRKLFSWGKKPKKRAIAGISVLQSLDVRTIRLVGTAVDNGQRFAWIRPLADNTLPLRVGLNEAIGQDGWYVAAIRAETLYLKKVLHGKTRQRVLHLPKV